jgi:CRISPR-associated protein Cas1
MGWRSVFIASPARLSVRMSQLVVEQEDKITIPLEDIGAIMIENRQSVLTANLLAALAEADVAVFVCNDKYLPCAVLTPFQPHSRQGKVMKAQLGITRPFAKQCWKKIVERKIYNQAACLDILERDGGSELKVIGKTVQSGDMTNREAYAAKTYFRRLLKNFRRQDDNVTTGAMNYGYAVLRGTIARVLASYGFMPAIGIHHVNELNAFNLADDFLEVYRPVVDLWVAQNIDRNATELARDDKMALLGLLHNDMSMRQERQSVLYCIEEMVGSFSTSCQACDARLLKLPELLPPYAHRYE